MSQGSQTAVIEEVLDIVDKNDCVIGSAPRSAFYNGTISGHFRAVNGFIRNNAGQLWIPRRVATKKMFPLCLDASISGHVKAGETYEEAFARETAEELGLNVADLCVRYLGKSGPDDSCVCFSKVYEITLDEVPPYAQDEFCEYYWLTPRELVERIGRNDKAKSDLPLLVQKFFIKPSAMRSMRP